MTRRNNREYSQDTVNFSPFSWKKESEDSEPANIILDKIYGAIILFRTIKKVLYYVAIHAVYRKFQGEYLFFKCRLVGFLIQIIQTIKGRTNEIRGIDELNINVVMLLLIQVEFVLSEFGGV